MEHDWEIIEEFEGLVETPEGDKFTRIGKLSKCTLCGAVKLEYDSEVYWKDLNKMYKWLSANSL